MTTKETIYALEQALAQTTHSLEACRERERMMMEDLRSANFKRSVAERHLWEATKPQRWHMQGTTLEEERVDLMVREGDLRPMIATRVFTSTEQGGMSDEQRDAMAKSDLTRQVGLFLVDEVGITTFNDTKHGVIVYTVSCLIGKRK
jgi:hypothetical protein